MTTTTLQPIAYEKAIRRFARCVRKGRTEEHSGELRLGVDLGTANIVLSVVDGANRPVAGAWQHSTVVRDGVVVDWHGATTAVRRLKEDLERRLRYRFASGSVAIPPGWVTRMVVGLREARRSAPAMPPRGGAATMT